jgi:hypothetical protein
MNDTPYRGRRTDSHKQKPPKKGSGKASFGITAIAVGLFLALPAGLIGGIAAFIAHGNGWI